LPAAAFTGAAVFFAGFFAAFFAGRAAGLADAAFFGAALRATGRREALADDFFAAFFAARLGAAFLTFLADRAAVFGAALLAFFAGFFRAMTLILSRIWRSWRSQKGIDDSRAKFKGITRKSSGRRRQGHGARHGGSRGARGGWQCSLRFLTVDAK
jgi:hypothetical protein